jgi:hypothetical protein
LLDPARAAATCVISAVTANLTTGSLDRRDRSQPFNRSIQRHHLRAFGQIAAP